MTMPGPNERRYSQNEWGTGGATAGACATFPTASFKSLTSLPGMTNTSTNHYHNSRLIGRVYQHVHTFFSNARRLTEHNTPCHDSFIKRVRPWRHLPASCGYPLARSQ